MCLSKTKNWWQKAFKLKVKPKKARRDIIVYKVLNTAVNGLFSPYQAYPYKLGEKKVAVELTIRDGLHISVVHEGYHAFINPENINRLIFSYKSNIYKAIIPKGSLYIKGDDNEIVSNQLIVLEKYKPCQ